MKNIISFFVLINLLLINYSVNAQVLISSSPGTSDPSALLEIRSPLGPPGSEKGILLPKVNIDNTNMPINSPAEALLVYNKWGSIGNKGFWYFNGSEWVAIVSGQNTIGSNFQSLTTQNGKNIWRDMGSEYQWKETPTDLELAERNYTCIGKVKIDDFYSVQAGTTTESWISVSNFGAPSVRCFHKAVWTGKEMIVWGGYASGTYLNTGGKYNPTTNSWTNVTTTNAPSPRTEFTAVWTGQEMIVWGGKTSNTPTHTNTGGKYNPVSNSWTSTSTSSVPWAREGHTAIWTGKEMIVWGGYNTSNSYLHNGGRYNPSNDSWTFIDELMIDGRDQHTAVWTGKEMIIWGGSKSGSPSNNDGIKYNPVTNQWKMIADAPTAWYNHKAVWTGTEMIVVKHQGACGNPPNTYVQRYNPITDTWTSGNTFTGHEGKNIIWTGTEIIAWGGHCGSPPGIGGGVYDSITNTWRAVSQTGEPSDRVLYTLVWTGTEMIAWGGYDNSTGEMNDGARYTPAGYPIFSSSSGDRYMYLYRKGQDEMHDKKLRN